jgi:hypothetical protein
MEQWKHMQQKASVVFKSEHKFDRVSLFGGVVNDSEAR